ncbi:hypothetical protein [Methylogaea oryzae]|uniref:Uncharacterized protein n=1 Tax=Methylogaea oryzae TaxID=1295382 RepID=A0A8D4VP51_9GAMM|nr:hypothetical protein [Methylogaea oryzae]BBL69925.1 hypothetical protein MoryE10_05310 [Methylogaea oryzae]
MKNELHMDKSDGSLGIIELVVSIYLAAVAFFLVMSRKIAAPSFTAVVAGQFRRPYEGVLRDIRKDDGFCWVSPVPEYILSDRDNHSSLVVFENGVPLPTAHVNHGEIRLHGKGRYSHWGEFVYFSTTDNTSPLENGREYSVKEIRGAGNVSK